MKKLLITAALLAGTQAGAFGRMSMSDCSESWEAFNLLMNEGDTTDRRLGASVRVTPQGWCAVRGSDPVFGESRFDDMTWRAEDIARFINEGIPPLALEFAVTGLDPDELEGGVVNTARPSLRLWAVLRQLPNSGQVIVERAEFGSDAGDLIAGSMVFERVFLSSKSMMQVSMGSVAFKAGLFEMTLSGEHENPFGFGGDMAMRGSPDAQRAAAFDLISQLPDGFVDDASRAEITGFAGELPRPKGRLELSLDSEAGFGLMQVGVFAAMEWVDTVENGGLAVLLDGMTLGADWSPATGQTD
ncbi:hypothetical protein [Octadecabacter sp. R77987]|uniref:hypothetical protein n=1 Tax=Octadecabacter sp. R77987 TaxID=3093874 RepID=UPI003672E461